MRLAEKRSERSHIRGERQFLKVRLTLYEGYPAMLIESARVAGIEESFERGVSMSLPESLAFQGLGAARHGSPTSPRSRLGGLDRVEVGGGGAGRVLASTLFDDNQVGLCTDEVPVGSWSRHRAWRSPLCTAGVTVTMRQASTHGPKGRRSAGGGAETVGPLVGPPVLAAWLRGG